MIRGRVVGALAIKADDDATADVGQRPDQMPLPTLDQRANFSLRSGHGGLDFTNDEYSGARALMLGAMAVDIAARSNARSMDGTSLPTELPEGLTALAGAPLEIAGLHSSYEPSTAPPFAGDIEFGEH